MTSDERDNIGKEWMEEQLPRNYRVADAFPVSLRLVSVCQTRLDGPNRVVACATEKNRRENTPTKKKSAISF